MKRVNAITVVTLVSGLTVAGCAQQPPGQNSEAGLQPGSSRVGPNASH